MKKLRQLLPFGRCQRRCSGSGVLHVRKLTSTEIKKATDGFNMILGSDSDGDLYKAQFADGFVAAIRKLKPSEQSKDTFRREVLLLARLHHRHLVKVVGFSQSHERFLAYEHMENGSLRDWLHDPLKTPLNWRTRLQIAVDVAAALVD
ncbi:putative receptor-like protein kinase [Apostasia shenzhenica]|uniref:Putative receptor-like protein kinase n=1 Tax=Apostasia shenzhenica TaxID=1088818 RepID=A0A2H9ZR76_9ASPA|nr:putative receptor-like protein kinase [Apostasia shenzhenica]